jgi:hypothetical protein
MNAKTTLRMIRNSIELVNKFEPKTSYDEKRKIKAIELITINYNRAKAGEPIDCGLYGKVKELTSHDSKSTIVRVQAQSKNDSYIIIDGKRKPLEVKTNGGRIASLYKLSAKAREARYIAYTLDFTVKAGKPRKDGTCKPEEHRYVNALMTVAQFIEIVEATKATKVIGHNDSDREIAVQSDSKKLYKALIDGNFMEYHREWEYFSEDFR